MIFLGLFGLFRARDDEVTSLRSLCRHQRSDSGRPAGNVALRNLLALTDDDGEVQLDSTLQAADKKVKRVVGQGKALMQSRLSKSFRKALPQFDSFVDAVDSIVQVSYIRATGGPYN